MRPVIYARPATPAAWSPSAGGAGKAGPQAKAGTAESRVHRSGETYRPAWIGQEGKPEVTRPAMRRTGGSSTVPGGEVVLIEQPAIPLAFGADRGVEQRGLPGMALS
jgi:hypothetical protein